MGIVLQDGVTRFEIVRFGDAGATGEELRFVGRSSVLNFLRPFSRQASVMQAMRLALATELRGAGPGAASDAELVAQLGWRILARQYRVLRINAGAPLTDGVWWPLGSVSPLQMGDFCFPSAMKQVPAGADQQSRGSSSTGSTVGQPVSDTTTPPAAAVPDDPLGLMEQTLMLYAPLYSLLLLHAAVVGAALFGLDHDEDDPTEDQPPADPVYKVAPFDPYPKSGEGEPEEALLNGPLDAVIGALEQASQTGLAFLTLLFGGKDQR